MLGALLPEEYAEIVAAMEAVPLDDGWRIGDTVAGALHDEMAVYWATKAGKRQIPKDQLHKRGDYIPRLRLKKRRSIKVDQFSIDETQRIIESQFLG